MTDLDIKVQNAGEEPEIEVEGFGVQEAKTLKKLLSRFMKEYGKKPAEQSDQEWLKGRFLAEMPEMGEEKAEKLSQETVAAVCEYDKNLTSLRAARAKGKTSDEWFADKTQEAVAGLSTAACSQRLEQMHTAFENANAQMMRTVMTNGGEISRNVNLDGFIAEQFHVNSFNTAAQMQGSPFHAEVCVPEAGQVYGKNSFDLVIRDEADRIVHQYQCKYGADAETTIQLIKRGNYNNQTLLVPAEQVEQVQAAFPGKTVVSRIGGTDKVAAQSEALTKAQAKELQIGTQERGQLPTSGWDSFNLRMSAKCVGQQAALGGMMGAALGTGFHLLGKVVADEPIETEEVVKTALDTGVDAGVKSAAAGALKIAAEKGMIGLLPPGTPMAALANIACVAIEDMKILAKIAKGELTPLEGLDEMGCNTTAMTYGLTWGAAGMMIGSSALGWIPIAGPIIGGLAGGMIGYMAGSKFGQKVYEGLKTAASTAKTAVVKTFNAAKSLGAKAFNGLKKIGRKIWG